MGWVDRLAELSIRPNMDLLKPNAGRRTIISVLTETSPWTRPELLCQANIQREWPPDYPRLCTYKRLNLFSISGDQGDVCPEGILLKWQPTWSLRSIKRPKTCQTCSCHLPQPPPLEIIYGPSSLLPGLCWSPQWQLPTEHLIIQLIANPLAKHPLICISWIHLTLWS